MLENFLNGDDENRPGDTENFSGLDVDFWNMLYADIRYQRRLKMQENDRLLRDYRSAWTGTMKDQDGSILDPPMPASYVQECMKLAGPQATRNEERKDILQTIGNQFTGFANESGVVFQQAANTFHIDPDDIDATIAFLQAAKAVVGPMAPDPLTGVAGQASSNYSYSQNARVAESSEERKRQQDKNIKAMEAWAEQSSKAYPRYG